MATVLNRTTKQVIPSANTVDFPIANWIINPDLSAVAGFSSIYWTITGDTVTLMNQAARDAVDAALLSAARDATAAAMDQLENYSRAFAEVCLDEFNRHTQWEADFTAAVAAATSLTNLQTRVAAIVPVPVRTLANLKTGVRNKLGT